MSCPSWETTCEIKIPKDSLFLVADVLWTSDHSSCPHLPGDTALHIFPFKTSEIILVMEKKHHLCRLWMSIWIYWYVCISHLCQCAMCQALIIINCIHRCLASICSPQCTTGNTPNDESMNKILFCS